MARTPPDSLDLQTEGLYFNFSVVPRSSTALHIGSFSSVDIEKLGYETIEPLQMFSMPRVQPLQARRMPQREKRGIRMPWVKKAPPLYQITGLMTLVLATSGLPARGPSGDVRTMQSAPVMVHDSTVRELSTEGPLNETPIHVNRVRADRLVVVPVDEPPYTIDDLSTWPDPSPRATTIASARALRNATREDLPTTLPPFVTDDGLGI